MSLLLKMLLYLLSVPLFCIYSTSGLIQDPPSFTQASYEVLVNETFTAGNILRPDPGFLTLSCNHSNSTEELMYTLIVEDNLPFAINLTTGELAVTDDLDYESVTVYNFTAVCTLENDLNCNDTASVVVNLLPVNEHRPVIQTISMFTVITELTAPGLLNSTLPGVAYTFSDMDQPPDEIYYTLREGSYDGIVYNETLNGVVLTRPFDRESTQFNQGNLTGSCTIVAQQFRVTVCDMDPPNDNCPNIVLSVSLLPSNEYDPVFSQAEYSTTVPESIPINTMLATVVCTDEDICMGDFRGVEIAGTDLEDTFSIDSTGNITNLVTLDYEHAQSYSIRVRCFDSGIQDQQRDAFTTVQIQLTDVNDNAPICSGPVAGNLQVGRHQLTPVLTLSCVDADQGNNSRLAFRIDGHLPDLPNGQFILNQATGQLTFSGEIGFSDDFGFDIIVSDSGSPPLNTTVQVRVNVTDRVSTPLSTTVQVHVSGQPERVLPMLVIVVVCVVGGLLLISCLLIFCCCCCFCFRCRRRRIKKIETTSDSHAIALTNVYTENQHFTSTGDREITLFIDEISIAEDPVTISGRQTPLSQSSHDVTTGDYVITNTVVAVPLEENDPLGLVDTLSQEQELNEVSTDNQESEESPKETRLSQEAEQQDITAQDQPGASPQVTLNLDPTKL